MPDLIVVTGPPGAGKSTVAAVLVDGFARSALVSGDVFFGFLAAGAVTPWLPEADDQNAVVTRAAAGAAGRLATAMTVVYDGVVGPWFLPTFAEAAVLPDVGLHYVVLLPALDVCLERVRTRVGHGFSDDAAARHMYGQFADADLDARHLLADPPADATRCAARIRRLVDAGSLLV